MTAQLAIDGVSKSVGGILANQNISLQVPEGAIVGEGDELPRGAADPLPQLCGPPDALALPERRDSGDARRG